MNHDLNDFFRPSRASIFLNCTLPLALPWTEKTPQLKAFLQERTDDHTRLEKEEFLARESQTKKKFLEVKKNSTHGFFKEKPLEARITEGFSLTGTPDVYGIEQDGGKVYVLDYKTGFRHVSAKDNPQLLLYGALVLFNENIIWTPSAPGSISVYKSVEISILNTQSDCISTFSVPHHICHKLICELKRIVLEVTEEKKLVGKCGDWCTFCPAKNYCPLKNGTNVHKAQGDESTDELLRRTLEEKKKLNARLEEFKNSANAKSDIFSIQTFEKPVFSKTKVVEGKENKYKKMTVSQAQDMLEPEEFAKHFKLKEMKKILELSFISSKTDQEIKVTL